MDKILKVSVAVGVLLLGISASYYFIYALPKIQRERLAVQVTTARLEREQQCSKRAEQFFNASAWSEKNSGAWYENHFNHKTNKCVILVRSTNSAGTGIFLYKTLMDVNDGKGLASWGKQIPPNKADYEVKPFVCDMLDKYCKTDEEFDAFVKPYMED